MLGSADAPQTADGAMALRARAVVLWRALAATALLSLALGAVLFQGVAGERSSLAPRSGGFSRHGLLSLPLAAQGPVSAALGADNPAYRISASNGGFAAANSAQRLSLRFGRSGLAVSSGATEVGLRLRAMGYGSSLSALGDVAPRADGNRVTYTHRGISEWYANGPSGLEQGFTVATPPAVRAAAPLTLAIAVSGNVRVSMARGGSGIVLARAGAPSLRYGGLAATDAHGRALRAWLQLRGGQPVLQVDARDATYPVRIDPFVQQGEMLTGAGEGAHGEFGSSVALSSDGSTALVGAPADSGAAGAAWVFTRSGSTWSQQGPKLTGGEASGHFGGNVALSADGNTALVASNHDQVWVFTRSGSTWTQQGEPLSGTEGGQTTFGAPYSVALSADGNTALLGDPVVGAGAAWVFTRSGSTWTQQAGKLTGSGETGEEALPARAFPVSSDGNTALIGGRGVVGNGLGRRGRSSDRGRRGRSRAKSSAAPSANWARTAPATASPSRPTEPRRSYPRRSSSAVWAFTRSGEGLDHQAQLATGEGESEIRWRFPATATRL